MLAPLFRQVRARGQVLLQFAQARLQPQTLALKRFGARLRAFESFRRANALARLGVLPLQAVQLAVKLRQPLARDARMCEKFAQTLALALKLDLRGDILFERRESFARVRGSLQRLFEAAHLTFGLCDDARHLGGLAAQAVALGAFDFERA
jgi:hypothetical protein